MKLAKKDLMEKISNLIEDDETKVEVLEDLEDSILDDTNINEDYNELKEKYDNLLEKYKDRFLKGNKEDKKDDEEKDDEEIEELEEEKVIDIKEI